MRRRFAAMGTVVSVEAPVGAESAVAAVAASFEELEARCSRWRPGSEASAIEAGAPLTRASDELRSIYARAIAWRARTGAAFDPHAGPHRLDLDGIVKAVALERAAAILDDAALGAPRLDRWSIAAGGDVLVRAAEGDPLRLVGIADPEGGLLAALRLPRGLDALATSGTAERGEHIRGRVDIWQASVLAADPVAADVLATAIVASPAARVDELLDAARGDGIPAEALVVLDDGSLRATRGLRAAMAAA